MLHHDGRECVPACNNDAGIDFMVLRSLTRGIGRGSNSSRGVGRGGLIGSAVVVLILSQHVDEVEHEDACWIIKRREGDEHVKDSGNCEFTMLI